MKITGSQDSETGIENGVETDVKLKNNLLILIGVLGGGGRIVLWNLSPISYLSGTFGHQKSSNHAYRNSYFKMLQFSGLQETINFVNGTQQHLTWGSRENLFLLLPLTFQIKSQDHRQINNKNKTRKIKVRNHWRHFRLANFSPKSKADPEDKFGSIPVHEITSQNIMNNEKIRRQARNVSL